MRITKKVVSIILAVLMVTTMVVVGAVSVSATGDVAQVGNTTYPTLQEAFDALIPLGSGTVKVLADCSADDVYVNYQISEATLDLNGKTITANDIDSDTRAFGFGCDKLIVKDSASGGKITSTDNIIIYSYNFSKAFVLESGTIEAVDVAVNRSDFKMIGGTINAKRGYYSDFQGKVELSGGTINATEAGLDVYRDSNVVMSGGTINSDEYGVRISYGSSAPSNTVFTMTGGTISATTGIYIDQINRDRSYSTKVEGGRIIADTIRTSTGPAGIFTGGQFTKYVSPFSGYSCVEYEAPDHLTQFMVIPTGYTPISTLTELQNACAAGGKYILGDNIELTDVVEIPSGNEVTLDLAGKDIIGNVNDKMIQNRGTLTINDSNNANPGHVYNTNTTKQGNDALVNYGTLVINNGYFGDSDSDTTNANIVNRGAAVRTLGAGANTTINGGYFTAIDNGVISKGYAYAIINGDEHDTPTTVINDATVYGSNNGNVANNSGAVTINDGSFTLTKKSATVYYSVYNGGTDSVSTVNDGTFNNTGLALTCIDKTEAQGSVIDLNDGAFTYNTFTQNDNYTPDIYGGTFSDDKAYKYIADGAFVTKNADGSVVVSEAIPTATTSVDASAFGLGSKDITNYEILGYQKNIKDGSAVRFVTAVNEGFLKGANIEDYGYVLAKASGLNMQDNGDKLDALKYYGGNGEHTVSCKESSNTLSGDYGKYSPSTPYKFVTAAVTNMSGSDQAVARFYIKTTDGNVYYANYDNGTSYDGLIADY